MVILVGSGSGMNLRVKIIIKLLLLLFSGCKFLPLVTLEEKAPTFSILNNNFTGIKWIILEFT